MNYMHTLGLGLLASAFLVTGCDEEKKAPSTPSKQTSNSNDGLKKNDHDAGDEHDHAHGIGPNGGVIFDLGKQHAEFTVDHPKKEVTVLFLKDVEGKKESEWPTGPVAAKELTLTTKEAKVREGADKGKVVAPMTITLKPVDEKDGKAAKFVGTDPGVGNVADFAGTVLGEIDGKPSQGEFAE